MIVDLICHELEFPLQDFQETKKLYVDILKLDLITKDYNTNKFDKSFKDWFNWVRDTNKGTLNHKWEFLSSNYDLDGGSKLTQYNKYKLTFFVEFDNPNDGLLFTVMWKGNY